MAYTILIVLTPNFDPDAGGVQRSTYKMSSVFKKNGHNTHVYTYRKKGNKDQNVAQLHIAQEEGGHNNVNNDRQLEELVLKLKPDIVINQMPYEEGIGKALSRAKGTHNYLLLGCLRNTLFSVKLNMDDYIQGIIPKKVQFLFLNKLGRYVLFSYHKKRHAKELKFILDTYDYFVMFGPPNIDELKYFVGNYKLNKTHLIPNSILSVEDEIPKKEKRILWLSRLSYKQKRADLILPYWKKVMDKLPDWHLDIVGNGDAYNDLKKQIEKEQISRVSLYGKQVPNKFYQRSPIYIMTSAYEGLPNTILEAQSFASVPIVFDSYPICSWVVNSGVSGILIDPFDIDKMAKETVLLANDNERQNKLMEASLKNAREFQLDKVGQKWLDFFDQKVK